MAFVGQPLRVFTSRLSVFTSKLAPLSSLSSVRCTTLNRSCGYVNSVTRSRQLSTSIPTFCSNKKEDRVCVTIKTEDGKATLAGKVGDTLLDLVVDNDYEIVGYGACEGTIACSTCHVILNEEDYKNHCKGVSEEEQDLLEMISHATTDTSRLGCQVYLSKRSEGMEVFVPPPQDIRED